MQDRGYSAIQAQGFQNWLATTRSQRVAKKEHPLESSAKTTAQRPCLCSSDCSTPELGKNKALLF